MKRKAQFFYLGLQGLFWDPPDLFGTPGTYLGPPGLFGTLKTIWDLRRDVF